MNKQEPIYYLDKSPEQLRMYLKADNFNQLIRENEELRASLKVLKIYVGILGLGLVGILINLFIINL